MLQKFLIKKLFAITFEAILNDFQIGFFFFLSFFFFFFCKSISQELFSFQVDCCGGKSFYDYKVNKNFEGGDIVSMVNYYVIIKILF